MSSGLYNQRIDARGSEPLYAQVMQRLRADLADGRLKVGQRLAPERELCARFGISRNTLRRALLDLEEQGLLAAAGRDGWYVAASPLVELARGPHSLTAWAREAGLVLTSRVMHQRLRPASPLEAAALGVEEAAGLFELERLRIVDGLALSLDRSCLPGVLAAALDLRRLAPARQTPLASWSRPYPIARLRGPAASCRSRRRRRASAAATCPVAAARSQAPPGVRRNC